jgi:hypothetical protein
MSRNHGGSFFMSRRNAFLAPFGPWYASPVGTRRDLQNPVILGLLPARPRFLGQASTPPAAADPAPGNEPFNLPQEVARDWADKIDAYMAQVQAIQDYVRTHPAEAAASGLVKDAAGLPPSGDLSAFPHLKAVYDKLRAGHAVTEAEMDLIPALGVALIAANQKMAMLQPTLLTTTNIAVAAGVLALAIGLAVLS